MLVGTESLKLVLDLSENALVRHGFRKVRRHEVVLDISRDFLGWVGLNSGRYPTHIRINPFVGIHCVPLMKLIADVEGEKYQLGKIATFAVHLGEICPDVNVFDFSEANEVGQESERLAVTLSKFGAPFMERHASYESLLPILLDRTPTLGGYPEKAAAALFLMGRKGEARQFVLDRRKEFETQSEIVRNSFDTFALPFLRLSSS